MLNLADVAMSLGEQVSSNDYYQVLGVDRAESAQGIHTAYRRLAKQCHPDLVGGHSKEKFQGIQEAYEVLSDPDKRKNYDASIHIGRRRSNRGIEPEPLAPSAYRSRLTDPEPLISDSFPIEEPFRSSSSDSAFSCSTESLFGDIRPLRQGFEMTEDEVLRFLINSFRWFRIERF